MINELKYMLTLILMISLIIVFNLRYSFHEGGKFIMKLRIPEVLDSKIHYNDILLNNSLCKRIDLSFADAIARDYMKDDKGRNECKEIENFVSIEEEFNEEFKITLNMSAISSKFNISETKISCSFQLFNKKYNVSERRNLEYFQKIKFEKIQNYTIQFGKYGYYYLSCFKTENKKEILTYDDSYYILPHNMSKLVEDKNKLKLHFNVTIEEQNIKFLDKKNENQYSDDKMNVLIIMVDSMSYPHFKRTMPQTYDYLKNKLENNIMYSSMNIVGENTLPNVLATISGVFYEGGESLNITAEQMKYETKDDNFFDKYPIIWKEYENLGYFTGYNV